MNAQLDIQCEVQLSSLPTQQQLALWINTVTMDIAGSTEISILITDETNSQQLNQQYRKIDKPTNVLSFPQEEPPFNTLPSLLGDLVFCAPIIAREANEQHKTTEAHWAHLCIHGTLHLLGYDHINDNDALIMQKIEIAKMQQLGYLNPYQEVS